MTLFVKLQIFSAVVLLLLFARESVSLFFNETSYINTQPLEIKQEFTLTFRTCKGGTLLRQIGSSNDYFELVIVSGKMNFTTGNFTPSTLALRWLSPGTSEVMVINVGSGLDQNKPYQINFSPRTNNATLSVSLASVVHSVDVPSTLLEVGAKNLTLGNGFVGCITFGNMFAVVNAFENVETSSKCPLDGGERCRREACPGYKGYYCETNIDDCASSPCHHASTCVDEVANYTCSCGPSWEGRNCDTLKNKTFCDDLPCKNGGICRPVDDFNNYTCTCVPPYTGRNCTETADPCKSMPCKNNATCKIVKDIDYRCECPEGYTGKNCQTDIDDCASADCGHGQCVDGIAQYSCDCNGSGYNGSKCEQDINECAAHEPCINNATCANYAGGYLCTCVGDFEGKNCEQRIDDCSSTPCVNGGNCTDLVKDFSCLCLPGFDGKRCEKKLHQCNVAGCTACSGMPCNHGNCSCTCTADRMFYNCTCEDGYVGTSCNQDINECMNGSAESKICGDNGTCVNTNGSFICKCAEGFAGRYCNKTKGPCNPNPCANGRCNRINVTVDSSLGGGNSSNFTESYNCSCFTGWSGLNCTEDINECQEGIDTCNKTTSACNNTVGGFKCDCKTGYGGLKCTDIDECKDNPCNGKCENSDGSYDCFCVNGFQGENCQQNINDCIDSLGKQKCKHANCTDGVAKFTCECYEGWTGKLCDTDINECNLGYCRNNATCNNTQGSYACTCVAGFTDVNCSTDIDDCDVSPCMHGGKCMDKVNDYECNCTAGYEGKACEIDIDWCNRTRNNGSIPCDYGVCRDGELNYTCLCFDGFSGQNCDIDIDECAAKPCKHSGICVQKSNVTAVTNYFGVDRVYAKNESGGYLCVCQPGYNGTNCENDIDECQLYQACNMTGTERCFDGINNYTCNCSKGFTGRNCSEDFDECLEKPCQNNGTCQNLIAKYKCICNSNYTGMNCESLVDPCTAHTPCQNGGRCVVVSDFNYTCICAEGFAGTQCTDRTTLGFDGTSSMSLSIPQTTANVSFSFQTVFPDGVLVSEAGKWRLSLVSGRLQFVCMEGTECYLGSPGVFTDSNWHEVGISLNGSFAVTKAYPEQRLRNCVSPCESSRARRAVATETQLTVGANYVGSIRDFSVNDMKYYPGVSGVEAQGLDPGFQRQNVCSPDPCGMNGVCKDLWTRYSCECDRYWSSTNCNESVLWGTFGTINQLRNGYKSRGNNSYASYSVSTNSFENLAFTVRTRSTSSLIVQLDDDNSTFVSIATDSDGFLRLRRGNAYISSQNMKINNGAQHYIYINRSLIQVDNASYDVTLTSFPVTRVFVGGLPELSEHAQFRGCLRDVRFNGVQLLFHNQTSAALNSSQVDIAVGCSGEDTCGYISGSSPCSNGGNCSDLWNKYKCTCQLPYGGNNCNLYGCEWTNPCPNNSTCVNLRSTSEYECINEVTFNSSQSSAHFTNSTPFSDVKSVVAQFRTRQNNTVILSSVHNATFFALSVQDGRINVMHNLAGNMSGDVKLDMYVSDGSWYEVKIESTSSQTLFKISTMQQHQDKFTYLNNASVLRNISLLNRSFTNLLSVAGVHIGSSSMSSPESSPVNSSLSDLLGCLREVRLGKHLLSFHQNLTLDSSPGFSLATSAFSSSGLSNVAVGCLSNNLCTSTTCGYGKCEQSWNDFKCTCPDGHSGDRCEVTPCTSSPCVNGTCAVRGSNFNCTCEDKYVGTYCNETCTQNYCKNGGECSISGGKVSCMCERDWAGTLCEIGVDYVDEKEDKYNLPLIIGLAVGSVVFLLVVIALICVRTRQTSSTFGTYSPSNEEKAGARVEMNTVLNVPPPEKLI